MDVGPSDGAQHQSLRLSIVMDDSLDDKVRVGLGQGHGQSARSKKGGKCKGEELHCCFVGDTLVNVLILAEDVGCGYDCGFEEVESRKELMACLEPDLWETTNIL